MELRNALAALFRVEMPATVVFDFPTVSALSRYIGQQIAGGEHPEANTSVLRQEGLVSVGLETPTTSSLVGVGCKYPGSHGGRLVSILPSSCNRQNPLGLKMVIAPTGLAGFYDVMALGQTVQKVVPLERWDVDSCYHSEAYPGKSYARIAAFAEVRWPHNSNDIWVCQRESLR